MVARIAGTMIVSVAVLVTVSLLVSFGVLWWTGGIAISASIGGVCGLAVAFAVEALTTAVRRAGERPCERLSDVNERSGGGPDRQGK
jgi:membrane associated rhomboid family serine protease